MTGPAPLTEAEATRLLDVSRETSARLAAWLALLRKWQPSINLVGATTLADPWRRHVVDSAQLAPLIDPEARLLVDLGSGAGLPGLILGILRPDLEVHLIESDRRKAAFLSEAVRSTGATNCQVHACRAAAASARVGRPADVITARALASVDALLRLSAGLRGPHTVCLFLKGRRADDELTAARKGWKMRVDRLPSRTDPDGAILKITEIDGVSSHRAGV